MEEPKDNKSLKPSDNKKVRIKFFPNRAADGVVQDKDGYALVDAKTAERLIGIKYAVMAEEKSNEQ